MPPFIPFFFFLKFHCCSSGSFPTLYREEILIQEINNSLILGEKNACKYGFNKLISKNANLCWVWSLILVVKRKYFRMSIFRTHLKMTLLTQRRLNLRILQGEADANWCGWHCNWGRTGVGWAEATTGSWAESRSRVYTVSLKAASSAAGNSAFPGLSSPGRAQNGIFQHETHAEWRKTTSGPPKSCHRHLWPSTPWQIFHFGFCQVIFPPLRDSVFFKPEKVSLRFEILRIKWRD